MSLLLASIPSPETNTFSIGPLEVHYYGLFIAAGAMLAVFIARRRYAARGGSADVADGAAFWALVCGFLGARLAYASTHLDTFEGRPWAILFIWEGGLALFGGLTGGALGALFYLRRNNGDIPAFADSVAPALPLAQAIGRFGNYFNQELYGTPTTLPWALEIDPENRVEGYQDSATFHPTFLYESLYNLVLVGALLFIDKKKIFKRRGSLIFAYGIGYGFGRFLLELIRTDTTFRFLGLSRNAYVALLVMLGAAVLLFIYERRTPEGVPGDNAVAPTGPEESAEAPAESAEHEEAHEDERDSQRPTDDDIERTTPAEHS
jgi:prolipoprotein diacylglyceryl transferase